MPEAQKEAFRQHPHRRHRRRRIGGAYSFKIGDKMPLKPPSFRIRTAATAWTFDLVGIFEASDERDAGRKIR